MMRKAMVVTVLALVALSGCGGGKSQAKKAAHDAQDVALVEKLNKVPFKPIRPEPFTADDIDRYDLARSGCMFRPGENPAEQPLFVAQADRGYLKIDGKLEPLAVKGGSAELPSGAFSTYIGMSNWIELVAQAGNQGSGPGGKDSWPSRLVIHDASERVAFDSLGQVSCAGQPAEAAPAEGTAHKG
jgi:hypothetical protein